MSPRSTLLTVFLLLTLLATTLTLVTDLRWDRRPELSSLFSARHPRREPACKTEDHPVDDEKTGGNKISLEVHIMSKCPDAKDCLEMLIAPAMEKIEDIVDFRMSFIGRPTGEGISCKHGPSECLGDTIHLCAAHLYDSHTYLPFALCLTHNFTLLPKQEFIESCAEEHGVDFAKLNGCASDISPGGGLDLLRKSVERSRRLNAEVSCTVRVDKEKWCVRDSGIWKDCEGGSQPKDLVEYIEKIHQSRMAGEHRNVGGMTQQTGQKGKEWIREERIIWAA